tara:strand:- start:16745 stop:17668 length:924 start_codon:yes stop_codon:yes gene_type:complete
MKKIFNCILVFFFLFNSTKVFSNINNSIIISVGNLPITYYDLVKEMRLVSLLTNNKIDNSNKEKIKNVAVQSLIKRKIKEMEIKKYNIDRFNKSDLERLIVNSSNNLGIGKDELKNLLTSNGVSFERLKKRFEIDLKWNTLIFELYKNKIVLNMSEIENKINTQMENAESKRKFLLSEIEIKQQENSKIILDEISENINSEGFEKTAKKFSISASSNYGGNIGWIDKRDLSKKIYNGIKNLKTDEHSEPIYLANTIVIIKKVGEKVFEKDIEKIKNNIIRIEKENKLQMFSKSHYSNLERTVQINFL